MNAPLTPESFAVATAAQEPVPTTDDDLIAEIHAQHAACVRMTWIGIGHARRCGELLLAKKLSLRRGAWLPWLEAHVRFGRRTAQGYMRLASRWDELSAKCATVAHLGLVDALRILTEDRDSVLNLPEGALGVPPHLRAPPQAFRRLPQRLEVDYCCPRCSYGWSGNPKPTTQDVECIE